MNPGLLIIKPMFFEIGRGSWSDGASREGLRGTAWPKRLPRSLEASLGSLSVIGMLKTREWMHEALYVANFAIQGCSGGWPRRR